MTRYTIYQGDMPTFTFTVTEDGSAMDLSGATCRFSAKAKYSSTSYLFNDVTPDTQTAAGVCTFKLTAANTATPGIYYGELEVTKSDDTILTVVQLELEIREQVGSA